MTMTPHPRRRRLAALLLLGLALDLGGSALAGRLPSWSPAPLAVLGMACCCGWLRGWASGRRLRTLDDGGAEDAS